MSGLLLHDFIALHLGFEFDSDCYVYRRRETTIPAELFRFDPVAALQLFYPKLSYIANCLYFEWTADRPVAAVEHFKNKSKVTTLITED